MKRFLTSRWMWFLQGLPSLPRALALFQARRYTMTTPGRCRTLWNQSCHVLGGNVAGSFVECGVWKGGSAAVMALALRHSGQDRDLHLFDSFEGLPEPTERDGGAAKDYSGGRASGALKSTGNCTAGLAEVKALFLQHLALDPGRVHFHVGWFQNTVPADAPKLGPIALLRLDGDWYESTRLCLEHLYPLLSPGGILILDDYFAWQGCAEAAEEFRDRNRITAPIVRIDVDAAYWIKP